MKNMYVEDVTRQELEAAYFEMEQYAEQVQNQNVAMRTAYHVLKTEMRDILWNKLLHPGSILHSIPPLSNDVEETNEVVGPYVLGKLLGRGSTARVLEGQNSQTGQLVALKIVDKAKLSARYKTVRRLDNEIRLTSLVDSPNVTRLIESFHTQDRLYLVLEHGGQDLFGHVSSLAGSDRLDEATTRPLLAQLVAGVCSLSAQDVVHHDIKAENVLVETDEDGAITRVRLTDLGMSQSYAREERARAFCGSPGFFPPEMVLAASYDPFKVDVWSVGCVAIELLLGRQWFSDHWQPNSQLTEEPDEFRRGVQTALRRLEADLEASPDVSEGIAKLVLGCVVFDPAARPTIEATSEHPFVL